MIHRTAIIESGASLGTNVSVGAGSYIGAHVVLGDNCAVHNHVTVTGHTVCGADNVFFPGAVVGVAPQDLKYKGELTRVEIGDDNVFREYVTVHAGTEVAGGVTRVGSHNRFLVGVHIAHDCHVGDGCILSNQVQLAGHVRLEDKVTMGGLIGVHHFTTIGTLAFVGGLTRIVNDVPPYMIVEGNPARVRGFNRRGLERWGVPPERIAAVRDAYMALFGKQAETSGTPMLKRLEALEVNAAGDGELLHLCASVRRSLCDGVFGRFLENTRRDTDADRRQFYAGPARGES